MASQPDRDADQIQADVGATRDRLAAAVERLVDLVHPQHVKHREVQGAKHFVRVERENLKALVFNAAGELRTGRLKKAGAGVAGFVGLLLALRGLVRRGGARRGRAAAEVAARLAALQEASRPQPSARRRTKG